MEWIFIGLAVLVVLTLAFLPIWKAKRHDAGTVAGRFNFDGYKESELSQRGVQDKTKWR